MDTKTIQSSLDYLLTPEGRNYLASNISEKVRRELIHNLQYVQEKDKKEKQKHIIEQDNFKIDKDLSVEEKLNNGWVIDKVIAIINGKSESIKILEKYLGDKAYVWEYFEGVPKGYEGEQKFNRFAVEKLGLTNKLPKNYNEFKKTNGKNHQLFMKNNFSKDYGILFSGRRNSDIDTFDLIGRMEVCRLGDGNTISLGENDITSCHEHHNSGCSVRLLKSDK